MNGKPGPRLKKKWETTCVTALKSWIGFLSYRHVLNQRSSTSWEQHSWWCILYISVGTSPTPNVTNSPTWKTAHPHNTRPLLEKNNTTANIHAARSKLKKLGKPKKICHLLRPLLNTSWKLILGVEMAVAPREVEKRLFEFTFSWVEWYKI